MAYPQETREQASHLYREGFSLAEVAKRTGVPLTTIHSWLSPAGQDYARRRRGNPAYREYHREYRRAYRVTPEQKERERERRQTPESKDRKREYDKRLRQDPEHRKFRNEYFKEYGRQRYATDPVYRILNLLRRRILLALKGRTVKSARTEELLGISALELIQRWDAEYGPDWKTNPDLHIDHIRPCSSFDLLSPAQQHLCFNWRNLQLLPAAENISKGDTWTPEMESAWATRMRDLGWEGDLYLSPGRENGVPDPFS